MPGYNCINPGGAGRGTTSLRAPRLRADKTARKSGRGRGPAAITLRGVGGPRGHFIRRDVIAARRASTRPSKETGRRMISRAGAGELPAALGYARPAGALMQISRCAATGAEDSAALTRWPASALCCAGSCVFFKLRSG